MVPELLLTQRNREGSRFRVYFKLPYIQHNVQACLCLQLEQEQCHGQAHQGCQADHLEEALCLSRIIYCYLHEHQRGIYMQTGCRCQCLRNMCQSSTISSIWMSELT